MPGATFDRVKNWQEEILTNTDLNIEIDNILENFNTLGMDDYSTNAAQMQEQTDPGGVGSESLATSLSGEIERLRFVIARILGDNADYWYEAPTRTLSEIADIVDVLSQATASHRTVSGLTTGNSNQLNAIAPDGTDPAVELRAAVVPFSYYIKNQLYTVDENVSVSGLLTAPSTNNTATINDELAGGEQNTEFYGQFGSVIAIDAAESEITSRVGQMAAFKNGNEIFIARIKSSTLLTNAFRGSFFDSSLDRIPAEPFSDDDTLTLLRLTWLFLNSDGEFALTYNTPTISPTQPTGAAVGDYWFDVVADEWKSFNSVSWVSLNVTLIGMCVQDATGTIAARTFDQALAISSLNQVKLESLSTSTVGLANSNALVSVAGKLVDLGYGNTIWNMASHLDAGFTEAANTWYYLYLTETGGQVISPIAPMFRNNLQGFYHPHELWRCVGYIRNDNSSDFEGNAIELTRISDMPYPPSYSTGSYGGIVSVGTPALVQTIISPASNVLASGLSVSLYATGKPVEISLEEDPAQIQSTSGKFNITMDDYIYSLHVAIVRLSPSGNETITNIRFNGNIASITSTLIGVGIPANAVRAIDGQPPVGFLTYEIRLTFTAGDASGILGIDGVRTRVREIL